ncbi:MAG: serine/threonine-protein kinase, partial [Myxococcota bacterium]
MATTGDESTSLEPELPKEPAPSFASGRPSRSLQGKIIAGKYRIEELVAQGGIGQVYLSTQLPLGRKVAVKVVLRQPGDGEFRKRFLLEASVCARLAHNNIVVCYDYGETFDGDLFMAMEYLGRRSLAAVLREERRLAPLRACRIALQIAKALRVAHRAGIIHRDLNASNVMLVADP